MGFGQDTIKGILGEVPPEGWALILLCVVIFAYVLVAVVLQNIILVIMGVVVLAAVAILGYLAYLVIMKSRARGSSAYVIFFIVLMVMLPHVHPQQIPGSLDLPTKQDVQDSEGRIIQDIDAKYNDINTRLTAIEEKVNVPEDSGLPFDVFILIPVTLLQLLNTAVILLAIRMWR